MPIEVEPSFGGHVPFLVVGDGDDLCQRWQFLRVGMRVLQRPKQRQQVGRRELGKGNSYGSKEKIDLSTELVYDSSSDSHRR